MTHLALARTWRPRDFASLVGQPHVVRALTRALETGRLHHAYLFTGTRGVGKTTLARILAKALNCETGVGPSPCGVCRSCTEIDAGRFVDYVEMDAASNRGVEEMTQLLEQASYAPSVGRYKIYTIDEVHMLSNHAFNAMLKTLEEPPAHVKFILATTDPQKIPVTVLSRCLQFNLRQMSVSDIEGRLAYILQQENVEVEPPALRALALAARGSMRDALSLTDQALAADATRIEMSAVREMLGLIDTSYLLRLLDAIANADAQAAFDVVDSLTERSLGLPGVLTDLGRMLNHIGVLQCVPGLESLLDDNADTLPETVAQRLPGGLADELDGPTVLALLGYARRFSAEQVQLYYTIVVHARAEMPLAPDDYAGFVMALLRLLQFSPQGLPTAMPPSGVSVSAPAKPAATASANASNSLATATPPRAKAPATPATPAAPAAPAAPAEKSLDIAVPPPTEKNALGHGHADDLPFDRASWPSWVSRLQLKGIAGQLATQSEFIELRSDAVLSFRVAAKTLTQPSVVEKFAAALSRALGRSCRVDVSVGDVARTAHVQALQEAQSRHAEAHAALLADPTVQSVIAAFDAQLVPESIAIEVPPTGASLTQGNDHV